MRFLFSLFLCCALLLTAQPAITQAATVYFTSEGQSSLTSSLSHNFNLNEAGGVDIVLVNRGPARWLLGSGRLPNGLTLSNTSVPSGDSLSSYTTISGTPTEEGTFPLGLFAITSSNTYPLDYTVTVYRNILGIEPVGVAQGRVGLAYLQPLTATGSISIASDLYWGITEGALPPGLTLDSHTGEIRGTPTVAGTYNYTVRMNELSGRMRVATPRAYVQIIQPATVVPVHITTRSNPVSGRVGTSYSPQLFRAEGGSGSYRWTINGGTLPPGLSLDATTGILSGTPTTAGTYSANIKALDATSETNSDGFAFTITIAAAAAPLTPSTDTPVAPPAPTTPTGGALTLVTASLPHAVVGTSYAASLSASGGSGSYSWNFASGALPPGLSLSASGIISGTPTVAGTYTSYIEVFDATGAFVGRSLTLTVQTAGSIIVTPPTGTSPLSTETVARVANLSRIGVSVHVLVKLPDDGNRLTQEDSAVYYIGADGRRHAFPNDRVFFSWYSNFDGIRVVSASDLASIPLGLNVTYKPGVKMVKFTTDPKVYAVAGNRTLRWVKTEGAASALYGTNWNRQIDDIADTFYLDYTFGAEINTASDYDRSGLLSSIQYVSNVLPL